MQTIASMLLQDLRYAVRQLRRAPGFALGVVLVLALGIGANAGMFTVLEATLFRPLPYERVGELVDVSFARSTQPFLVQFLADTLALRDRNHTLAELAYYNPAVVTLRAEAKEPAERTAVAVSASPNLFGLLGLQPALGRGFSAEEQQPGKGDVVVLSDLVWRTQFHAATEVLGRTVEVDGRPATVIGVMPRGFLFPADGVPAQIWRPLTIGPKALTRDFGGEGISASMIARLRPGVTPDDSERDLSAIQAQLASLYPQSAREFAATRVAAVPYRRSLSSPEQRSALLALLGAVAALWLIACANVAGLMLARSTALRRQLAIRAALGASRWRLLQQSVVEAMLLSLFGGGLGLLLAQATLQLFRHRLTQALSPDLPLHADARVLLSLLLLSTLSAVLFGVIPSLLTARIPTEQSLRQDGAQAGTSRGRHRLQRFLIVTELALTLGLLVSCGLLLRTTLALRHVPLGFRVDHVFVVRPELSSFRYRDLDRNKVVVQPLLERLRALPGVDSTAVMTVAPLEGGFSSIIAVEVGEGARNVSPRNITAGLTAAGPELQKVLGFRMLRGRYFAAQDTVAAPPVAVVNSAFARLYEPAGGAIGTFSIGSDDRKFRIVGVVDDYHQAGIARSAKPEIILNAAQMLPTDGFYQPTLKAHAELLLRSSRDAKSLLPELARVLREISPDLADSSIQTMDQIVEDSIGSQILAAHLLETFGGLALVIALTGLYSLLAYLVTLRTRELGLRLALGAQRSDILALVLGNAGALLLAGVALGAVLSLAGTHLLSRFLFGVQERDMLTLFTASALLLACGLAAAWLPARRAAALDPMQALRTE